MFEEFYQNIIESNSIRAVELYITSSGEWQFAAVSLKKSKGEIFIEDDTPILSKEDFTNQLDTKMPHVLLINGNGILNKNIENLNRNPSKLLQEVLPNADSDDFVFEIDKTNIKGVISVMRKEQFNKIIAFFKDHGVRILDVYLGLSVINVFSKLSGLKELRKMGYSVSFNEDGITKNSNDQEAPVNYTLGKESHSSVSVGAISTGMNHWLGLRNIDRIQEDYVAYSSEEDKNRNIFRSVGVALLGVLFIGLLLNTFMFQHYSKKVAGLQIVALSHDEVLNELDQLTDEIAIKKDLIQSVGGVQTGSYFAFYADRIAATVPEQLILQKMLFRPLSKNLKENKKIQFATRDISLEGLSDSSAKLNAWMSEMRSLDFIKKVELVSYLREGKNKGLFELEIELL